MVAYLHLAHASVSKRVKNKEVGLGTCSDTGGPFWPPGACSEPLHASRQKLTVLILAQHRPAKDNRGGQSGEGPRCTHTK